MGGITNIKDTNLVKICNNASVSALDVLEYYEFKSIEWLLHTSGLAYGIWVSVCDEDKIDLDDIDKMINEMVISHLN